MEKLENAASGSAQTLGETHSVHWSRPHDLRNFRISLKQWRMLHAVIDCGGFTDAAKFLHLSQSAISYTIAKLQEQLGIPLLKIEGRKAHVTEAGRALLERSRHLIREALELEEYAENMRQGWGTEVRLVVDHNFPTCLLMLALRNFSLLGCNIKVCLSEVTMPQAEKALCDQTADLAIIGQVPPGFLGDPLIDLEYIAVAHPDHVLFRLGRDVTAADLERQIQIVICSSKEPQRYSHKTHSMGYIQRWDVSSVDTAVEALRECLGYAWLSKHRIRKWLDLGQLKVLPLSEGRAYKKTLYLVRGRPWIKGSGAGRLAEVLHSLAAIESVQGNSHFAVV